MIVEHRVSGYDFVRAMQLAGYRLIGTTMGHALLEKGVREVLVPQRAALTEDELVSLLRLADVGPGQLVALLHRLGSRDTWPAQGGILPYVGATLRRVP